MRINTELDPTKHPVQGYARAALERGQEGSFSCPLISHVEGGLWTGGCIDTLKLADDFDYVLSLYPWQKYRVGPDTEVHEVTMYDSLDQSLEQVDELAQDVADRVRAGQKVLVHCQAGLNRSGLVAARALTLMGRSGVEAISLLREKRSPMVLCNETFENWIAGIE